MNFIGRIETWQLSSKGVKPHWIRLKLTSLNTLKVTWYSSWSTVLLLINTMKTYSQLYSQWWSLQRMRYMRCTTIDLRWRTIRTLQYMEQRVMKIILRSLLRKAYLICSRRRTRILMGAARSHQRGLPLNA